MDSLLTEEQWRTLTRLYVAGRLGIEYTGNSYTDAGSWPDLLLLRDTDPPLIREVFRLHKEPRSHYFVVITEAGERFYEHYRRIYDVFYP